MLWEQARIALTIAVVFWTLIATYSLVGLFAVWGILGRGHWFWKTAAALAFPSIWLLTSDPRLCLLFLTQTTVVLLRLWYLRGRSDRVKSAVDDSTPTANDAPPSRRFSLTDLLLVFVLLSGVFAMLARMPPQVRWDWYFDVLPGAVLGCFTLVAVRVVESERSRWLRVAALVLAFPAILMAGWLGLARSVRGPFGRAMAAVALIVMAVLPARVYYIAYQARTQAYPSQLADNGYVDLLRAAEAMDDNGTNLDTLSPDELRTYLSKQTIALDLLRRGLSRRCQALLYEEMNDTLLSAEGKRLKKLSEILAALGRQELQDGQIAAAVESYLADIELGAAMTNGGVMMHDGFGFMCERLGVEGLQKIVSRLDDEGCRELAERLAELDARREPIEAVQARERLYFSRSYPWKHRERILEQALRFLLPDQHSREDMLFGSAGGEKRARARLLICHLALRRFWLANGDYPTALEELVPQYLPAVPLDPFADLPLTYKKLPASYLLYSIGYDRVDDSGSPSPPLAFPPPDGDIVVPVDLQPSADDSASETGMGD